jgi:hypothetical protein
MLEVEGMLQRRRISVTNAMVNQNPFFDSCLSVRIIIMPTMMASMRHNDR